PQARPVFGIAAVVGLFMCVTELSARLMIYPPGWQTMSIYIAYYLEEGLAARSILMAFLLLLLVETTLAAASLLSRKYKDAFRRNIFFGAEQSTFLSPFTAALPSAESKGNPVNKTGFLNPTRRAIMKVLRHMPFSRASSIVHPRRNRDQEIQALLAENEALRRRVVIAEQKSLRMQINPHFFFNTLNTIVSLISRDPQAAAATIGKLSALFRYTLDAAEESAILLAKELEYIRTYLEIEKLRFGDRLSFSIDVPSELYSVSIPPMLIQPLIENAIRYGKDEKGHSYVHISGRKESGWLTLSVADYGIFRGDVDSLTKAPGTGIRNVMQRLEYSRAGKLRFLRNKPQGVIAQLYLILDQ
ncbi:MAG: histidine kinase, partial [Rectinema sp.]|nr:histidine kinase [Rectinema sp.]